MAYLLAPRYPEIPSHQAAQAPSHAYYPGGDTCRPDKLRALPANAKGAAERARCEDAAEQEQRAQEAVSESRYASDIAKQALAVAEYQGVVFYGQALATVAAFLVASFAGWAAYRAFRAAEATLLHAQEVAAAELRPYVFPAEVTWKYHNTPGNTEDIISYRYSLNWNNSGKTPARRIFSSATFRDFDLSGIPDDFNFPDVEAPGFAGSRGPGQGLGVSAEIPRAHLDSVYEKKKRLFIWAWVEYDGIAANTRYRTEACFEVLTNEDPAAKTTWQFIQAAISTKFNGADVGCMHPTKT